MNLGKNIFDLRKKKNITQEELAAELGVTAAAVSKWEKGYTLPDILMLCALADYFQVSTDELLGRAAKKKHAIIVAETEALGQKIADLVEGYQIRVNAILTDYEAALAVVDFESAHNNEIDYLFTAIDRPLEEQEMDKTTGIMHINVHITGGTEEDVLDGIEFYLKNMDAFKNIRNLTATRKGS